MKMKTCMITLLLACSLAASCSIRTGAANRTYLNEGDTVTLNKSFTIPELYSHVIFQDGELVTESTLQHYDTSCIADTRILGPKTIRQKNYRVSRVIYYDDWYSFAGAVLRYYTEFHLDAVGEGEHIVLTCQVLDGPQRHHDFPLEEIKQATGEYFSFSSTDNK